MYWTFPENFAWHHLISFQNQSLEFESKKLYSLDTEVRLCMHYGHYENSQEQPTMHAIRELCLFCRLSSQLCLSTRQLKLSVKGSQGRLEPSTVNRQALLIAHKNCFTLEGGKDLSLLHKVGAGKLTAYRLVASCYPLHMQKPSIDRLLR